MHTKLYMTGSFNFNPARRDRRLALMLSLRTAFGKIRQDYVNDMADLLPAPQHGRAWLIHK